MTETRRMREAIVVREIELSELGTVHGVTCDAAGNVWFAEGDEGRLFCVEPSSGRVLRHFDGLGARAGTAFDGTHLWQLAGKEILRVDPASGEVDRRIPAPNGFDCSGMAWAEGALWIGDFHGKGIVKVDAETGAVLKRIEGDRFVTGVAFLGNELWHGAWDDAEKPAEPSLRHVDASSGEVIEEMKLPADLGVSGLGADAEGRLWCGGGWAGGLRAVRRDA